MRIPFVGQAYTLRSRSLASQSCVNFYVERSEVDPEKMALYGTPGTRKLCTLSGSGGIRQIYVPSTGQAIVVRGNKVYRLSTNWTYTLLDFELSTQSGYVSIADNGTDAVLVDGIAGYVLNLASNVITKIANEAFYGADRVGFLDGYFIFNKPQTQQFYISGLYNTTFDGLDFASAEGSPDMLISLLVDHREVWMFGDSSTEVFYNSGNSDFPIERIQGAFIEHGCAAKHSVAKLDNTVFWIGKDANGNGTVWRANGYTPQRVSTHAIEYAFQSYPIISDAIAYTYQQDGHAFYVLTFPTAGKTWCYDVSTVAWHERSYRDPATGKDGRHRSSCLAFYGGKHIVGDYADGRIYHLDPDFYSDDGDPLISSRSAPVIQDGGKRVFFKSIEIFAQVGVGAVLSQQQIYDQYNDTTKEVIQRMGGIDSVGIDYANTINDFVTSLVDAEIWLLLDSLQIYATKTVDQLIDWRRYGIEPVIVSGSFVADTGYLAPNSGSTALRTLFTPSVDGMNFTLDNAEAGVYMYSAPTSNPVLFGAYYFPFALDWIYYTTSPHSAAGQLNQWGNGISTATLTDTSGLFTITRSSSTAIALLQNNVQVATGYTASNCLNVMEHYVGVANNSTIGATGAGYAMYYAGASLTTDQRQVLLSAFNTYLAAL